ncbi:hypothetical protein QBC45DRAFT_39957 [Copromyces sp. CBS 386.78]|nr:hypothetical protein QBC45DRAFT_39957 [Copromyces sp. CBS 386.78]
MASPDRADPVMAISPFDDGQSALQLAVLRKESSVVAELYDVTRATKRTQQAEESHAVDMLRRIGDRRLVCVEGLGGNRPRIMTIVVLLESAVAGLHQQPRQLSSALADEPPWSPFSCGIRPASRQKSSGSGPASFWPHPSIRKPHSPAVRLASVMDTLPGTPPGSAQAPVAVLPFPAPLRVPRAAKGAPSVTASSGLFGGALGRAMGGVSWEFCAHAVLWWGMTGSRDPSNLHIHMRIPS